MSINPFNITNQLLPEDENGDGGETICVICQDDINSAPTYSLPECLHKYHTHCIVTWFRSQTPANEYECPNNKSNCPLCGNKGINNLTYTKNTGYIRGYLKAAEKMRKKFILNYIKKNECPKELAEIIKRQQTERNKLVIVNKDLKELCERMKNENTNYHKTRKGLIDLRNKRRAIEGTIYSLDCAITYFPIVPIIIPISVDIN